jgi:hypothetical protein
MDDDFLIAETKKGCYKNLQIYAYSFSTSPLINGGILRKEFY